jgi:hypothetical protein
MQDDWQTANLRYFESSIAEKFESRLRVGYAFDFGFEAWKTLLFARRVFNPAEEVVKCFVKPVRDILQDLTMDLRIVFGRYLDVFYDRIKIIFVREEVFFVFIKKFVIDFLANSKLIKKFILLFPRRIQTIRIHPTEHHTQKISANSI